MYVYVGASYVSDGCICIRYASEHVYEYRARGKKSFRVKATCNGFLGAAAQHGSDLYNTGNEFHV